jgi:hypothetical protein
VASQFCEKIPPAVRDCRFTVIAKALTEGDYSSKVGVCSLISSTFVSVGEFRPCAHRPLYLQFSEFRRMVAYRDGTAFLRDYFRVGGDGTPNSPSSRSIRASAI